MKTLLQKLGLAVLCLTSLAQALEVGQPSLCVVLQDKQPNGSFKQQCIRTRNHPGQYVFLDFAMPKCEDCLKNLPGVSAFARANRSVLTTRIVALSADKAEINEFIEKNKNLIDFPISFDLRGSAARAYGVDATPTTFVLDPSEKIIFKHVGILTDEDFDKIEALIH